MRPAPAPRRSAAADAPVDTLLSLVCVLRTLQLVERDHPWLQLALTMAQLKTLMLILQTGGMPARDLAARLHVGRSAVTPLVDRLVAQRLVRREPDPGDRRMTWVRPTAKAFAARERLMEANRTALAEVWETVPARDRAGVHDALRSLLGGAEQVLRDWRERSPSSTPPR